MKIGFVLDDGLDREDGVQQYILNLGKWLTEQGHEAHYLVGETKRTDIANVHSLAKNMKVKFNGNALSIPLPSSGRRIKKLLAEEDFDVIHVQVPYSPFMGAKVVRYSSDASAIVGTFHILPYGWMSSVGTWLLGIWLKFNLRRFDKFFSVSEPAAVFAKKTFRIDSEIVPNSVDTSRFKSKKNSLADKTDLRLLFVGRLVYRKGCQQLLKALAILQQEAKLPSNLRFDICGDGPMRSEFEKYVKNNDLESLVKFHGYVSEEQKIDFMQKADISIFPSLSGESFGIVLIEAMAAGGGIVLAGNNPGYISVVGSVPGSIVSADSPELFAQELLSLIENPQKRQDIYKSQQEIVEQFSVDVVGQKILDTYKACQKNKINQ